MKIKIITLMGLAALVVGAVVLVLARLAGGEAAIEAVPTDAEAVAFFDVKEIYDTLTSDRVSGLLGEIDPAFAALDETLADKVGMTFADDVLPWVGTTAAVWARGEGDAGEGCLVISARNPSAADEFVSDLLAIDGVPDADERAVKGGTLFEFSEADHATMSIGRVGGVLLVCGGEGAADASIEALGGDNITNRDDVLEAADAGGLVVGWIDLPALASAAEEMGDAPILIDPEGLAAVSVVFDVTDAGLEWTATTESTFGAGLPDDSMASRLPADTFLALFGRLPSASMFGDMGDIDTPGLGDALGLASLLDGPFAIGITGADGGALASMLDIPLDLVAAFGSSDPAGLGDAIRGFAGGALELGPDLFTESPYEDGTLYTLTFPFFGDLAAMAVTDDVVAISGSEAGAKGEGPRLTDAATWQAVTDALDDGVAVSFYFDAVTLRELDLSTLLSMAEGAVQDGFDDLPDDLPSPGDLFAMEQLTAVVAGSGQADGGQVAQLLVLLDW